MSTFAFEKIVRPFQTPQVSYPTRIFDTTVSAGEEILTFEFGKEGGTKVFQESFAENSTIYQDLTSKEQTRKVHKKRVENEDDPDQFVDVEVIDKLTVKQGQGSKYQKTNFEFKNKE
jgi:hypothetical protein